MFSPIKFVTIGIREPTDDAPHAYIPFQPAVKSSQPLVTVHSTLHELVVTLDKNDYLWTANLLFLSFIAKSLAVFFLFARKFM